MIGANASKPEQVPAPNRGSDREGYWIVTRETFWISQLIPVQI